ncbi:MAG: beta-Ala-His dipeptidase [Butyrivibrio sp.]|nr:beta-Ala-His dipeptidase [Butyrivibrio sp.]
MERMLENLEPKDVFYYFEEICNIPHVSYHTQRLGAYCEEFAQKHGLRCVRDEAGNVVTYKSASQGFEDSPTVIIQGHLDMVGAKTDEVKHNFLTDPIKIDRSALADGFVTAVGTTLGGDDGIAVAYALAILADNSLKHPALEVVLTTDEEVGLLGAGALDFSLLSGKCLLNLDSEDEGSFLTGCAGGVRSDLKLPVRLTEYEGSELEITIGSLLGGHSGTEIGTGRPSANVLMGRLLKSIDDCADFYLVSLEGGTVDNAIAPKCTARIACAPEAARDVKALCERVCADLRTEYAGIDDGITIICEKIGDGVYSAADDIGREKILCLLRNLPYGVMSRSASDINLVETSLNLGVLRFEKENEEGLLRAGCSVRSSFESAKRDLADRIGYLAEFLGGEYEESGNYPAWPRRAASRLCEKAGEVYERMYGRHASFKTIHAGLECGIFADKRQELDMISYGPLMKDIHTPDERLDVASVKRVYEFTIQLLEALR